MAVRRNGIVVDDDGPWTAACFLRADPAFEGTQHGVLGHGTLCGLTEDDIVVVRHPFHGDGARDCAVCAERLAELAGS